ncbi:hypothetical protein K504DRAFT_433976 [Pleomassaria siparia CBS 279.74]|uniref:Uncharacterized protein n=1 Tax=Pleomassaria siparia CBS 279.74 TaxID=1314801 RepID=A0A6G1K8H0_9PLEO|nr:hypothetical protein K504DRAFT_433976 [Pleomassaria siparia CBS 279.74]
MTRSARSTVADMRTAAGHSPLQWLRFYRYTKKEARIINKANPNWTWPDVPFNDMEAVKQRVNAQLAIDNIPQVNSDVIWWRMILCMRDVRAHASAQASAEATVADTRQKRPFDPVRDV